MAIYNFYLQRGNGEKVLLLSDCTEREAMAEMQRFLNDHKFKSYYARNWIDDNGYIWFDVGNHNEFFIMEGNDNVV